MSQNNLPIRKQKSYERVLPKSYISVYGRVTNIECGRNDNYMGTYVEIQDKNGVVYHLNGEAAYIAVLYEDLSKSKSQEVHFIAYKEDKTVLYFPRG